MLRAIVIAALGLACWACEQPRRGLGCVKDPGAPAQTLLMPEEVVQGSPGAK